MTKDYLITALENIAKQQHSLAHGGAGRQTTDELVTLVDQLKTLQGLGFPAFSIKPKPDHCGACGQRLPGK